MTVVADSSVLNYLILIDTAEVLRQLFNQIAIPEAVAAEVQRPWTPSKVATWISQRPDWLRIQRPVTARGDERLEKLGAGEREAIALAMMYFPDVLLLLDETKGRTEAQRRQIRYMGTLGVLDKAAASGLLDLPSSIERLLEITYVAPGLLKDVLEDDARRKKSSTK